MKLLLDTHVLLWAAAGSARLSRSARRLIEDPENALFFSVASIWEIVIKRALERSDFEVDPPVLKRALIDNGYQELPILSAHALFIEGLPKLHKDPFDRLLIAQASVEGVTLLTADEHIGNYPGPILKI